MKKDSFIQNDYTVNGKNLFGIPNLHLKNSKPFFRGFEVRTLSWSTVGSIAIHLEYIADVQQMISLLKQIGFLSHHGFLVYPKDDAWQERVIVSASINTSTEVRDWYSRLGIFASIHFNGKTSGFILDPEYARQIKEAFALEEA